MVPYSSPFGQQNNLSRAVLNTQRRRSPFSSFYPVARDFHRFVSSSRPPLFFVDKNIRFFDYLDYINCSPSRFVIGLDRCVLSWGLMLAVTKAKHTMHAPFNFYLLASAPKYMGYFQVSNLIYLTSLRPACTVFFTTLCVTAKNRQESEIQLYAYSYCYVCKHIYETCFFILFPLRRPATNDRRCSNTRTKNFIPYFSKGRIKNNLKKEIEPDRACIEKTRVLSKVDDR